VKKAVDAAAGASWRAQVEPAVTMYVDLLAVEPALTVAWSRDLAGLGPRGVALQQEGIERYASAVRFIHTAIGL
jgi:hypothetical protein